MANHLVTHTVYETAYWLKAFLYLPYFWYVEGVRLFLRTLGRTIIYLDQATTATLNLRLFFVPLFGDYSIMGRILALPFRIGRIVAGFVAIILATASILVLFLTWLAAPFLLWQWNPQLAGILVAVFWGIAFLSRLGKPHRLIKGSWQEGFYLLDFAEGAARRAIRAAKNPTDLFQRLAKSNPGKYFFLRLGPHQLTTGKIKDLKLADIYRTAYELALKFKFPSIQVSSLLAAFFDQAQESHEESHQTLLWEKRWGDWISVPFIWEEDYQVGPIGGVNRGWTGRVTPTLDTFSTDLTLEAVKGRLKPLIGKQKPLSETARILRRKLKANALLVGPPGSGKTSLVHGIAREIIQGTKFEALQGKRVIRLDVGALVAGAPTEGELGARLQRMIGEIETSRGIILFVDEIHSLIVSGAEAETAFVFNTLRPHLVTGKFQLIGATSWENYRKYLAPNEAFAQVFELVEVPEAAKEESMEILEYEAMELERTNRKTKVTFPAIKAAVEMSDRLIYERVLPDKAVDLLEEAVLAKEIAGGGVVGEEEIAALVAEKTKVPVASITQKEAEELLNLEDRIHEGLINQEEAVKGVSDALRRARAGLLEEEKPIASFLFVGPTGVGKTQLSKVLAKIYFAGGADKASAGGASFGGSPLVRIDMTEFADLDNIYRLIGSPPGARVPEPGQLTEAIRQRPFSLVLLDEFEKAHPQIRNLFLQVFDDGRLTDGKGETVDFTNTIIIATSNAGTKFIQDQIAAGRKVDDFKKEFLEELRSIFPPELLNRFDGVMVFRPLSQESLVKIVALKLKELEEDLAVKKIKLQATPEFMVEIARLGYAPQWGARPLTRVIQNQVQSPLARKILAGEVKEGQTVTLDLDFLNPQG